ncbi:MULTISPECIES: hypothetical protein [Streptomyces]|uniref:Uncharacterized protein n=2 Tax=Streptomyces TaxID=1883 RepID=A0ABV9IGP1_9ACTN
MACHEPWHDRLWRFLQSPLGRGMTALGMLFGPMDVGMSTNPWAEAPAAEGTVSAREVSPDSP